MYHSSQRECGVNTAMIQHYADILEPSSTFMFPVCEEICVAIMIVALCYCNTNLINYSKIKLDELHSEHGEKSVTH
jgi:hypothetical protein